MVRKAERVSSGTLVLDSQALSLLLRSDADLIAYIDDARDHNIAVVISSMTVIEARDTRIKTARLNWVLSGLEVREVTLEIARAASDLLGRSGLHGHHHAIDAVVAVTAMREPGPVLVVTSDPDDLRRLCDDRVAISAI
ncbi:DNA-binding protein [Actinorugispora endophytica]|uniref:PIN domain-containing protein n=1 Tax=Actinorugispora endophytica TaxID=1605990 RepID=A0A4R6V181_9ACTN|nr:DNA-binding protein [Actinorugispora endophytica]TDQ53594.1 hypothetical protein EV190_10341 [Actinorugispora endophytica]